MSFKGMRKSIRTMEAPTPNADASTHLSDEFPTGYSLTRCSPAELVSASPVGVEHAPGSGQLRGSLTTDNTSKLKLHDSGSTLTRADSHNHSPRDSHDHSPTPGLCVFEFVNGFDVQSNGIDFSFEKSLS
jgi:hypothetical protein